MNRTLHSLILFLGAAVVSAGCLLATKPACASADKIQEIQQALANKKASHALLTEKAAALSSEVTTLKNNLIDVSRNLITSENGLSETEQRLKDLQQKKTTYTENLSKDQKTLNDLVSAARRYSQTSTSLMLVETKPVDAARASIVMKSIIPAIHQQSVYLQSRLSEIAQIEEDIAGQLQLETQQNRQLNAQKAELAKLLEERNKLYLSTESQRREQEREVVLLTKESKTLEELMEHLKSKSKDNTGKTAMARGELPANILLPVHGNIRSGFGDKDELGAESKGITFMTRAGASVITPLAGTVKFAGAFQNYKQILIVEHPGGYHSLITGLGHIDTVVGAALAAGEPVGMAETSGSPQIYYELRHNGKPVNPQKLLIAQRKQEKS
ncbi:MAG: peptidoglycan DD-metalloendopeptidase family protein [Proteobacteria bacterium]|nr:peptidoglycan DD-metalloendopeptidase family protein [Pseudomonadota bacterium]